MTSIIIASGNAHKAQEIQAILGEACSYNTLKDFPSAPEPEETADTFEGNASIKAESLADWLIAQSLLPSESVLILADDSGLEVDALNKAPGVHSARFAALDTGAKGNSSDADNNAKLLKILSEKGLSNPTARFRCVLSIIEISGGNQAASKSKPTTFSGSCEGTIQQLHAGNGGFGYDPIFIPAGYDKTFGELGEDIKNSLSHRSAALKKLKIWMDARTEI